MTDKELLIRIKIDNPQMAEVIDQHKKLNEAEKDLIKIQSTQEGSMARLRAETSLLVKEANNMIAKTKEEIEARKEVMNKITENKEKIRDFDRSISGSNTLVGEYSRGIKESFGEMGMKIAGTIGIVGGLEGAFKLFESTIDSTGKSAAFFKDIISGAKSGMEVFMKSLATGDFTNFFVRFQEGIASGVKFSEGLRQIAADTRALGIAESEERLEAEKQRSIAMDASKDRDVRLEAIEEIIHIEEKLVDRKKEIADFDKRNLLDHLTTINQLTEHEIESYVRRDKATMASLNLALKFSEENKRLDDLNRLAGTRVSKTGSDGVPRIGYAITPEQEKERAALTIKIEQDKNSKIIQDAIDLNKRLGNLTTEEKDEVAKVLRDEADIETQGLEHTRRIRQKRGSLIAELMKEEVNGVIDTENDKIKAEETAAKLRENNYTKEQSIHAEEVKQQYVDGLISANEYEILLINEAIKSAKKQKDLLEDIAKDVTKTENEKALAAKQGFEIRTQLIDLEVKRKNELQKQTDNELKNLEWVPGVGYVSKSAAAEAKKEVQKNTKENEHIMEQSENTFQKNRQKNNKIIGADQDAKILQNKKNLAAIMLDDNIADDKKLEFQKNTNENIKLLEEDKEKEIRQGKLDTLDSVVNALGKQTIAGKAAAMVQAGINTFLAASSAFVAMSAIPPSPLWGIIAAASATAIGLKQEADIAGVSIPAFASGGKVGYYTGMPLGTPLPSGDNQLAYVKRGEVILNENQQARLGGSRTFANIGVPGFASGGLVGNRVELSGGNFIDSKQIAKLMAGMINEKQVVLNMNDLVSANNTYSIVKTRNKI